MGTKLAFAAAALIAAAVAAAPALAQNSNFNPGTVVGNVMERLPGCGFGLAAPGCAELVEPPAHRPRHKAVQSGSR